MAWAVEYTDTARTQLRKLDRPMARRVLDYMDAVAASSADPRERGRALSGPMGGLWRYRVGRCRVICDIQDDVLRVLVLRVAGRDRVYR
ncbi:MAG: type II toxin-antitoxin system RelE/ParE family toxin [Chloroflexota bacterium]|nr:type II toxin-antitoxin system RelE/ParE family toxin [Chloroflexota bacterium]